MLLRVPKKFSGYLNRAVLVQDLSAGISILLMVKKFVCNIVDGFDEKIAVAFNDVDLCKTRAIGIWLFLILILKLIIMNRKSRGYEDIPDKKQRFQYEDELFYSKWGRHYINPYYNINLTLQKNDFSLKI